MSQNLDSDWQDTLDSIRKCALCELPLGPRPVLQYDPHAKILIAGQAPGRRVHESGVPFDDPSGDRLRDWMGVTRDVFYDRLQVIILPMGFCYPGTGGSGDLPPRPKCAATWRGQLMGRLANLKLTLVIGRYAQQWHLPRHEQNLTKIVRNWDASGTGIIPLPHPSPRNNAWIKRNPWFLDRVIPELRRLVRNALAECK